MDDLQETLQDLWGPMSSNVGGGGVARNSSTEEQ